VEHYVGIDVSLKESSVCVVDSKGKIVRETKAARCRAQSSGVRGVLRGFGLKVGEVPRGLFEAAPCVVCGSPFAWARLPRTLVTTCITVGRLRPSLISLRLQAGRYRLLSHVLRQIADPLCRVARNHCGRKRPHDYGGGVTGWIGHQ
jgi:hypothetical protein